MIQCCAYLRQPPGWTSTHKLQLPHQFIHKTRNPRPSSKAARRYFKFRTQINLRPTDGQVFYGYLSPAIGPAIGPLISLYWQSQSNEFDSRFTRSTGIHFDEGCWANKIKMAGERGVVSDYQSPCFPMARSWHLAQKRWVDSGGHRYLSL